MWRVAIDKLTAYSALSVYLSIYLPSPLYLSSAMSYVVVVYTVRCAISKSKKISSVRNQMWELKSRESKRASPPRLISLIQSHVEDEPLPGDREMCVFAVAAAHTQTGGDRERRSFLRTKIEQTVVCKSGLLQRWR